MPCNIRKKWIQVLVLAIIGIVFYLFLGQEWITLADDSPSYLYPSGQQGVMPVYPLFLFLIRRIFGENRYLDAVVVIQSLIALLSTMAFVLYLKKQFSLNVPETILLYLACMLPFSIYLPEAGITHYILTEGLTYALFYIYFLFLLNYVLKQETKWLLLTIAMSAFLELTRSQLIFVPAVTAAAFICVESAKHNKGGIWKTTARILLHIIIAAAGVIAVIAFVYKIYGWYLTNQLPDIMAYQQETTALASDTPDRGNASGATTAPAQKKTASNPGNPRSTSQFTTLIVIRGVYEIDETDIALFDTKEMQEIFRRVFEAVDEQQYRYVYARQDLYIWKDLVKDGISPLVSKTIRSYLEENPGVELDVAQIRRELGLKILLHHFDRYLYHSMRLMISSFIASVFFQIEKVYLLCHIITLFLFAIDAAGIIYCLKFSKNKRAAVFAFTTTASIAIMVVITDLVFIGLQRYVVYAMGIFYCSLYLLAKDVLFTMFGLHNLDRTWRQLWEKAVKRLNEQKNK